MNYCWHFVPKTKGNSIACNKHENEPEKRAVNRRKRNIRKKLVVGGNSGFGVLYILWKKSVKMGL